MVTVEGAVVVATCGAITSTGIVSAGRFCIGGSSNQETAWLEATSATSIAAGRMKRFIESSLIMMPALFSLRM
jgi:hypothetical protein